MAKDREPQKEERKELPEDLPGNKTDLPGRNRPNEDIERMPGQGGATEKI
jgi:hypothetical protein